MATLVTALFQTRGAANVAVDKLLYAGFSQSNISMLMSETTRGKEFTVTTETKAPEGAAAGGLVGALAGMGIPEHEAKFFSDRLMDGGILVGVYTADGRARLAKDVLGEAGGDSVKAG